MPASLGRVLVVDDIPANVRLLEGILTVAGYDVITATGGEEALRLVGEAAPDVVLMDVMMPDMDGFEVCRRIRSTPDAAWLPVVMVTALHETSDRVTALEAGADDFLTKPVNAVEVEARVKSLVRVKRQRDDLEKAYSALQRAESMRDGLSMMLVHDLRTPLSAILGSLETIRMVGATEIQTELLDICMRSANRLLSIVNDLLDISKMESGQMQITREAVNISSLVEDSLDQLAPREDGKRVTRHEREVELQTELADDLPQLHADYDLISRVLINLIGNAIKFEPRNGVVKLVVRPDHNAAGKDAAAEGIAEGATAESAPRSVLFSVHDNGPGVAPEDQQRIFEKFSQVESSRQGRKFSTGLGLTFCQLAVQAHGGHIWVESTPGQGSTFYFNVPLEENS